MKYISLDFETYSEADIRECGAHVYARHPSTEVLIACYSFDEGETVRKWRQGDPAPGDLFNAISSGRKVRAFNADFEELIWEFVCTRIGWPEVSPDVWVDTMSFCNALALPGSLEKTAEALCLDIKKNKDGRRLIRKFSRPRKPTKNNPATRLLRDDDPDDFELFVDYCADDVRVECEIFKKIPLKKFIGMESDVYEQNRLLNKRGVVLDVDAFEGVRRMIKAHRKKRISELQTLTSGAVETEGQRDRFLAWAKTQKCELPGFTKADLTQALLDDSLPDKVRSAIDIRLELSQVSTKKYEKMANVCCSDGRARGNLTYHRASTGRNGGSGLQLHNFPRDYISTDEKVIQDCIDFIGREQYDVVEQLYGNPLDVAKGLLRNMIIAPEGQVMYVADFSGVENRGTAWVARDPEGLRVFRDKRDQYKEFAAAQFKIRPEDVTPEQRTAAKATILGAIFGSGWRTIHRTNQERGIPMTEQEARRNVEDFRRIYSETVATWYGLEKAASEALRRRSDQVYKQIKFGVRRDFLFIRLPSGRLLAYHKPRFEPVKTPWGEDRMSVTFMGLSAKKQWIRMTLTINRLIENVVSAICRDLLMYCQLEIEKDGRVTPVLNVHDEIVSYGEPDAISLKEYEGLMEKVPDWAVNDEDIAFPLEAEGYIANRYRK